MLNILIFSDQNPFIKNLVDFLENNDCKVEVITSINKTFSIFTVKEFDAIYIDLENKKNNSYIVISKIREFDQVLPIMVFSSRNELSEKLFTYKLGADDYILKSNSFEEILIRTQILIKKIDLNKFGTRDEIIINDLKINLKTLNVFRNNIEIELTKKEFLVLKTLAEMHGQIINKAELMKKLWQGEKKAKENVVEVCVNSLRKKIDKNFDPKLIHTKVGLGYYLA